MNRRRTDAPPEELPGAMIVLGAVLDIALVMLVLWIVLRVVVS